jgi:glyceraldehyde-3-phosphate dehydrogenase/erythrose-4-phosphate dehydrogenase
MKRIVHVVGTGTIGEPLTGLLVSNKRALGIDEVTFHKRTPTPLDQPKIKDLIRRGAKLCVGDEARDGFDKMDLKAEYEAEQAIEQASVVIDCTPAGNEEKERIYSKYADGSRLFLAQGSEFGFGKPYARGINDEVLVRGEDQYLQIVSCNTHNIAVIVENIALKPHGDDNLAEGRFICIRRANDITQSSKFIPAPEVGSHGDPKFGTHHARDVYHLYGTKGVDLNVFSSAMKVNTQYMHIIQFSLKLNRPTDKETVVEQIRGNDRLSRTNQKSSGVVFSFGRDHGAYGRILNQTVFAMPSLHVSEDGKEVTGYCFTPQDGNSLLSSISAAVWHLYPDEVGEKLSCLAPNFFSEI